MKISNTVLNEIEATAITGGVCQCICEGRIKTVLQSTLLGTAYKFIINPEQEILGPKNSEAECEKAAFARQCYKHSCIKIEKVLLVSENISPTNNIL